MILRHYKEKHKPEGGLTHVGTDEMVMTLFGEAEGTEAGETSEDAAYRELWEETGIGRQQICLYRLMDITYYHQKFVLEMFVGKLEENMTLREEKNPLLWLPLTENFADPDRFAGEQNIAHIINVALKYPIPER